MQRRHFGSVMVQGDPVCLRETLLALPVRAYSCFEVRCLCFVHLHVFCRCSLILATCLFSYAGLVARDSRLLAVGASWIFIVALHRYRISMLLKDLELNQPFVFLFCNECTQSSRAFEDCSREMSDWSASMTQGYVLAHTL